MVSGTAITWTGERLVHLEVLVEDRSGSIALEIILEKILGKNHSEHSWKIHPYQGQWSASTGIESEIRSAETNPSGPIAAHTERIRSES